MQKKPIWSGNSEWFPAFLPYPNRRSCPFDNQRFV